MSVKKLGYMGVVGGMGNEAMADLAEKIAANSDGKSLPFVFFGNSRLAYKPDEATKKWKPTDPPEVRKKHTAVFTCRIMQHLGCSTLGLACNSAHGLFRSVMEELPIDFVDMVEQTACSLQNKASRVLVLGVDNLVRSGLYQDALTAAGIEAVNPSAENQQKVMSAIYDPQFGIKTSTITKQAEDFLCEVVTEECAKHDCHAIILGCTELPLALTEESCARFQKAGVLPKELTVIDASNILAQSLLEFTAESCPLDVPVEEFRSDKADWFAPVAFAVSSVEHVAKIQNEIMEETVAYLADRDQKVTGSYQHIPTLFFTKDLSEVKEKVEALGCSVYDENTDVHSVLENALGEYYESMS